MKALVMKEYNRLVYEEAADPEPGPDEVLIRVKACGICGSDVHGMDGSTGRRVPPLVMGHEAAGIIAEVGERVHDLPIGARVTFDSTIYCGSCDFCRQGRINLCDNRKVIGVSCDEYSRDGAFAEYIAVPRRIVYPFPDSLKFEHAAIVEPLSVAVHAVGRAAVSSQSSALVIGAGMIGLLIIQVLKVAGCSCIYAADLDRARLELALELGADEALGPEVDDIGRKVLECTAGIGVDAVFEAVGLDSTVRTSIACLRKGGSLVLVGNLSPEVVLPLQKVVARELSLYGSCASSGEYPECLRMLSQGVVKADRLLSACAPLSEGAEWFRRLYEGEKGLIKVCLLP